MGLYIARGLVDGHGGRLSVDSKGKGEGTTFTLELPLYEFIESELPDGFKSESMTSTTADSSKDLPSSHHVLVVDDVATNRKMLIRLLERSGHTCVPAADGIEAIRKYEESKATANATQSGHQVFDCLLLDYEMPGTCAQHLHIRHLPVIRTLMFLPLFLSLRNDRSGGLLYSS